MQPVGLSYPGWSLSQVSDNQCLAFPGQWWFLACAWWLKWIYPKWNPNLFYDGGKKRSSFLLTDNFWIWVLEWLPVTTRKKNNPRSKPVDEVGWWLREMEPTLIELLLNLILSGRLHYYSRIFTAAPSKNYIHPPHWHGPLPCNLPCDLKKCMWFLRRHLKSQHIVVPFLFVLFSEIF